MADTAHQRAISALRSSGYASGGEVHSDVAEDKKLIRGMLSNARIKLRSGGGVPGQKSTSRPDRAARGDIEERARGGAAGKHRPGIGKVNVIVANTDKGAAPPMPPRPMAPPMPHPPMAPPMPAPGPSPAPMAGPAGPPGSPMMRPPGVRRGGSVKHRADGGAVAEDRENNKAPFSDAQDMERARDPKGRFMGGSI